MKVVWAEKHRPSDMDNFRGQEHLRAEMNAIMSGKSQMQHFVFYSREPGTGKTTLAYMLANNLNYQIHKYNASSKKQRGIEFIEEEISLIARSGQNEVIVLLDEADQLTKSEHLNLSLSKIWKFIWLQFVPPKELKSKMFQSR